VVLFPLLAEWGINVTPLRSINSASDAIEAAGKKQIVLKADTPRLVHKSDAGGVILNVTAFNAADSFERLRRALDPSVGDLPGEGIVAAPMLLDGIEFYVGAKYDEGFGSIVACGMGGRFLEILGNISLLIAPFSKEDAVAAIERSGALKFLSGFRGGPIADVDGLASIMVRVGLFALALGPKLQVLDLNPVIVTHEQRSGCAADARLILQG
jgi:succinyl-CoA synthetase beta subunit